MLDTFRLNKSDILKKIIDEFQIFNNQIKLGAKIVELLSQKKTIFINEAKTKFTVNNSKIVYNNHNLANLLQSIFLKYPHSNENLKLVYEMVFLLKTEWINKTNFEGLKIDTEMSKFHCKQCGNCCIELNDAYINDANEEDLQRWKNENRDDILSRIDGVCFWISPKTGEDVGRCPWLRKLYKKDKYKCLIHNTKPKHCREYPKSKKHALNTGCNGFNQNYKN